MTTPQVPTVGRIVHYYPSEQDRMAGRAVGPYGAAGPEPLAAIVTHVWGPTYVNLAVFDKNGTSFGATSVTLEPALAEGATPVERHAYWPPRV